MRYFKAHFTSPSLTFSFVSGPEGTSLLLYHRSIYRKTFLSHRMIFKRKLLHYPLLVSLYKFGHLFKILSGKTWSYTRLCFPLKSVKYTNKASMDTQRKSIRTEITYLKPDPQKWVKSLAAWFITPKAFGI